MTSQEEDQNRTPPRELPPALEAAPLLEPPVAGEHEVAPAQSHELMAVHSDFASFHEGYVRHYIALADTKAGVSFTLAAGVIGYLLSDGDVQNLLLNPSCSFGFVVCTLAFILLGAMAATAFLVIAPNLSAPSKEGLVFFSAVANRPSGIQYVEDIASSTDQELTEARLKHCYDISTICSWKYKLLKRAIWLAPPSLLFGFLTILLS